MPSAQTLEEQNAELIDRNATLEDEYKTVASYKPLVESYRNQIDQLEAKNATLAKSLESAQVDLEKTRERLCASEEEAEREKETSALYEERVKELELEDSPTRINGSRARTTSTDEDLDDELGDVLTGTTTTDLKIKLRKVTRDLEEARKNNADASRLVVVENLLEDANRMKGRYEADYLQEHRERLKLVAQMEEIRSGASSSANSCAYRLSFGNRPLRIPKM